MTTSLPARRWLPAAAAVALILLGGAGALALAGGDADAPAKTAAPPDAHHPAEASPPEPPTPADALVAATAATLQRWTDVDRARADGYRSIGDALTGHEHFVHWAWAEDATTLDPERPESLVYAVGDDGARTLVSAMYILPPGSTLDDAPDLGDERAVWHDHDDLCWSGDRRVAGLLVGDRCIPGGEHAVTPPMLHVWIVEHPCGPFAGLDGHGEGCDHADHG